ncbi:MAG: hypothetical protein RL204_2297 [Bacteroidota bacterium]|jgi:hypothetical protein
MLRNYKHIAISCLLLIGCRPAEVTEKNFYTQELLESDVLRLPIKFPYDLITIDQSSPWQSGVSLSERLGTFLIIDSINVKDKYIFFNTRSTPSRKYIILDLENNDIPRFLDRDEYLGKLDSLKIRSKLFPVDSIFSIWRNQKTLPWK